MKSDGVLQLRAKLQQLAGQSPDSDLCDTRQKVTSVNLPSAFMLDKTEDNSTTTTEDNLRQEFTSPPPALCNELLLSTSARPPGLQLTARPAGRTPCQTKLFSLPPSEKGPGKRGKVSLTKR